LQLIEQALKEGCSMVVDNTNPTVEDRATGLPGLTPPAGAHIFVDAGWGANHPG
jgi:hypothetical protein